MSISVGPDKNLPPGNREPCSILLGVSGTGMVRPHRERRGAKGPAPATPYKTLSTSDPTLCVFSRKIRTKTFHSTTPFHSILDHQCDWSRASEGWGREDGRCPRGPCYAPGTGETAENKTGAPRTLGAYRVVGGLTRSKQSKGFTKHPRAQKGP